MTRIRHICQGGSAAENVQAALGAEVCVLRDDCATGPLQDVDAVVPQQRCAFWAALDTQQEIRPPSGWAIDLRADRDTLVGLASDTDEVVIWAGESSTEQMLRRRVHWWLQAAALPVSEVIFDADDRDCAAIRASVASVSVAALRARFAARRQLSSAQRQQLADAWQILRDGTSGIREWGGNEFLLRPIDGCDAQLLRLVGTAPARFIDVLGRAMAETGRTDMFCKWRFEMLQQAGRIVLHGAEACNWRSALVSLRPVPDGR